MRKLLSVFLCLLMTVSFFVTAAGAEESEQITFKDVKADAYYYDAVMWALEKGITTGTSADTFSPNNTCTRGQVVTFLWRASGEPEPNTAENPFTDVTGKDYFYKAVLWAVERNITTGTSKTTFSPGSSCTRAQTVTFLWRAQWEPEVGSEDNPFEDVKDTDYFYDAVLWAVDNDITTGTSEKTFSPSKSCSRGQIVTFLYRKYCDKAFNDGILCYCKYYSGYAVIGLMNDEATDIVVPSKFNGKNVDVVGVEALMGTGITSLEFEEGVVIIYFSAFQNCTSLKSVVLPDSLSEPGTNAFYGCTSLTSVTLPGGIWVLGEGIFVNCDSLENIQFKGTMEQFNNIDKLAREEWWTNSTGNYTVHCTDGDITY